MNYETNAIPVEVSEQTMANRIAILRAALNESRHLTFLYGLKTTDHLGCAMQVYNHLDDNLKKCLNVFITRNGGVQFWNIAETRMMIIGDDHPTLPLNVFKQLRTYLEDLSHEATIMLDRNDAQLSTDKILTLLSNILSTFTFAVLL